MFSQADWSAGEDFYHAEEISRLFVEVCMFDHQTL